MNLVSAVVAAMNGTAYLALGALSIWEVAHGRRRGGVAMFGLGFALMASSCGPHHLIHAHHLAAGGSASPLLLIAMVLALAPGLTFVYLRVMAMLGRSGDRFVRGTPSWIIMAPLAFLLIGGLMVGLAMQAMPPLSTMSMTAVLPNLFVSITYGMVGWPLVRTQIRRRAETGGWSVSGLALSGIFPTCSLMHLLYAATAHADVHSVVADLWGIPASVYFLWVVRSLHHDAIVDWNRRPAAGEPRHAPRPSPWARAVRSG